MILDRKKRIILFVILSFIYFLFFNMFTFKVHAITYDAPIEYQALFKSDPSDTQSGSITFPNIEARDLYENAFYFSLSELGETAYYYQLKARIANISTKPYNAFVLYSPIQLSISGGSLTSSNNESFLCLPSNNCVTEVATNTEVPVYFYIFSPNKSFLTNINYYGGFWDYNSSLLFGPKGIALSELYGFDSETERNSYVSSLISFYSSQTTLPDDLTSDDLLNVQQQIKDSLVSSEIDDSGFSSTISSWTSSINNNSISNLITLPITFLRGVSDAISGSCSPVNYIELYNYQVTLPCLNLSTRLGSVWVIIDTIFSLMLIYSIGKSLVQTFARLSDMDTNIMYECYSEGITGRSKDING